MEKSQSFAECSRCRSFQILFPVVSDTTRMSPRLGTPQFWRRVIFETRTPFRRPKKWHNCVPSPFVPLTATVVIFISIPRGSAEWRFWVCLCWGPCPGLHGATTGWYRTQDSGAEQTLRIIWRWRAQTRTNAIPSHGMLSEQMGSDRRTGKNHQCQYPDITELIRPCWTLTVSLRVTDLNCLLNGFEAKKQLVLHLWMVYEFT